MHFSWYPFLKKFILHIFVNIFLHKIFLYPCKKELGNSVNTPSEIWHYQLSYERPKAPVSTDPLVCTNINAVTGIPGSRYPTEKLLFRKWTIDIFMITTLRYLSTCMLPRVSRHARFAVTNFWICHQLINKLAWTQQTSMNWWQISMFRQKYKGFAHLVSTVNINM